MVIIDDISVGVERHVVANREEIAVLRPHRNAVGRRARIVSPVAARVAVVTIDPDFLSLLTTFIADVRADDGQLVARAVREVWTPMYPYAREYYNLLWPTQHRGDRWREYIGNVLRRQGGIGVSLGGDGYYKKLGGSAENPIRGGQRIAMTNVGPRSPYLELPQFPEAIEANMALARENYKGLGRYGPVTAHLHDERRGKYTIPEIGDTAMGLFRAWLENEYGDIAALNAEWATHFASFNDVTPLTDPVDVIKSERTWAPWMDLCNFVERESAIKYDVQMVELIQKETRGHVMTGFEGIFGLYEWYLNPYGGLNVPLLYDSGINMNNMAYGIGTPMWELCASLNPEAEAGTWMGYESEKAGYYTDPWRGVLSGATFTGWFIDTLWFTAQGAVDPRLGWIEESTRPLRQGVGRMLNESRRQFEGVAILANMRSSKMAWMQGQKMDPAGKGRGNHWMLRPMNDSGNAMLTICRDYGIAPAYITEGQIVNGRLNDFKALMLVYDISMRTDVAEAIREWVRKGGVIITDCGAGVANEHGTFGDSGQLDDVFGIGRQGPFTTISESGDFTVGLLNPPRELVERQSGSGNWYMVEYYEPNVTATTARACGKYVFGDTAQMCFWNAFGEGHTLYMGFLLNRYDTKEHGRQSVYPLIAAALNRAGVLPSVRIKSDDAMASKGYTVNNFIDRGNRYTGIMKREKEMADRLTLAYDSPGHYYEVMGNRYLGAGDHVTLDLASTEATQTAMPTVAGEVVDSSQDKVSGMALVAQLPYKIAAVSVAAKPARPGEDLAISVRVTAEDAQADRHVLYLDVRDPDGNQAEPYTMNVVTTDGRWEGSLPLAINERTGEWTLTVREAVSGMTDSTKVAIP
ncbi:MAG: beta-galactosidase [Lentisphaerae bacterium]|nr:beta-galactosidase [Lentisphaerota bacterium]